MFSRKLTPVAVLAALMPLTGLVSQQAAAIEEVVVYGARTAAYAQEADFRTEMQEYVRSFNEQLRDMLQEDLKRLVIPKLELAAGEPHIRG